LYRIDFDNRELTKIGNIAYGWGNSPDFRQMTYDPRSHKLYVTENNADLGAVVVEIDPETAVATPVFTLGSYRMPTFFVSYDPAREILFIGGSSTPEWEFLQSLDLTTKELGTGTKMLVLGNQTIGAFFDYKGHPWLYSATDNDVFFQKFPPMQAEPPTTPVDPIAGFTGYFPIDGGSNPDFPWIPEFWSFSFDPYTDVLFATVSPLETIIAYPPDGKAVRTDSQHTILCTMDPTTGTIHKVIATYKNPNESHPFYPLYIAWGFSE
jgi:hypothetical protein